MGVVQMITMVQLCDKSIDVHRVCFWGFFFTLCNATLGDVFMNYNRRKNL